MSEAKFKTLRHIETVRNFINVFIKELLHRGEVHDQTKLQSPEAEIFEIMTAKLRTSTYGSPEYKKCMEDMKPAIEHHNAHNRHHPEHFKNGIQDMNLIDLMELLCDWKSASMRHNDGNIEKSLEINQQRFNYSDELKQILRNTVNWMEHNIPTHHADES